MGFLYNFLLIRSILELVRIQLVKQSLLRGTAHFAACLPVQSRKAKEGGSEEVPPRKSGKATPARRSLGVGGEPHR